MLRCPPPAPGSGPVRWRGQYGASQSPIAEDGISGPRTAELAEALESANLQWFAARQILRLRDAFYRDLAARRPSLKVFLEGWRNRVKALAQYLGELEREAN